jgi:prepilin-type processing-associated H-X9-DG protein
MRYNRGKDPYPFMTWLTQLLPYIEQDALWHTSLQAYGKTTNPFQNPPHSALATTIGLYTCPADGRVQQSQVAQKDNLLVALTSYLGVSGQNLFSHDGVLFADSAVRLTDITDGTSQTLLAGERPPSADFQFGWWYAGVGQMLTGSADSVLGVREQNWLPPQKAACPYGTYSYAPGSLGNQCDLFHYWSLHDGGANFLFADGSLHFIAYSGAPVLPSLATRQGNDVVAWTD